MSRAKYTLESYTEEDRGYKTPCWIFHSSPAMNGYCLVTIGGIRRRAHVASYERNVGPIPAGYVVHHLCEVHNCVNPEHLVKMTQSEHSRIHHIGKTNKSRLGQTWKHTEAAKAKMRQRMLGNTYGIKAFAGRTHTEETKAKMRASARAYWARKKSPR